MNTEQTRKRVKVSEHWFVYSDDPINLLYEDGEGKARSVKYAKNEFAERHWTPDEIEWLRVLRRVYPDESRDWWLHYDEIREQLIYLFPGNQELLELLKPRKEEKQEEQKGQEPQQATVVAQRRRKREAPRHETPSDVEEDIERLNRELAAGNEEAKYQLMEALDEKQIVEYLEGRLISEYFYEFDVKGRKVVGISFAGTIHAAKVVSAEKRKMGGGIEVLPDVRVEVIDDGRRIEAFVRAVDRSINFTVLGHADQDLYRWNREKQEWEPDPFARRAVVSKAERNALRQLIPEKEILDLYRQWKASKGDRGGA